MSAKKPPSYFKYACCGCGHETIIDKFYKTRRVFCGVCGGKNLMDFKAQCDVKEHKKAPVLLSRS
ncbi:DNA-directed RNA polymerase subunit RPC12/RpoP [Rossellomorea marisflavi]